jgi:prolyl oligopeptidase
MTKLIYPPARKGDTVDNYHGTMVADPYRWLEDPDSHESRAWIEAENEVTSSYLAGIPEREAIKKRLTELWNYERYGVPFKRGGRYFYERNNGLQNQNVIYTLPSLDAEPHVLLDPNTLSEDGTVALSSYSVSENGRLMAYGLSVAGSDWNEWKVRDVEFGQDLSDHIRWVKFSGASWLLDGSGFYYSRFAEPKSGEELQGTNYFQKLYFHKLGTPQEEDPLIYEDTVDPQMCFNGDVTEDGRYLMIYVWKGDPKNAYYYKDLADPHSPVVKLLDQFDARYSFIGNDGPLFYFRTNKDAPMGRLIAIDIHNPEPAHWREVIPETKDKLNNVEMVGERFIAEYLTDAHSQIKVFSLDGIFEREVALPGIGAAYGFTGHRSDTETFYGFISFTTPATIFRYDIAKGESALFRAPKIAFASSAYETSQIFYESRDGTRVPMFLTHRKGLELNGSNPTYLSGYGGFNIPLTPFFNVGMAVWMERGGVLAVPGLRGGSEYGEAWHEAGMKENKQNVFNDFIAAAEWLIGNEYTSTPKLAIEGGSNGGLLVGACITQRPELFGAALPAVGVMDMLRFHKFTIGWAWVGEYGSADNPEDFPYIYAYSPLHNLKPGTCYPPTLITTADHDDRVVPAHSFKFAAAIQAAQGCENPVLIRIETKAGHGAGKPVAKIIETATDRLAFLTKALGINS